MALYPQYRLELYKKITTSGDNYSYNLTPTIINNSIAFSDISYRGGIENTKDTLDLRFANYTDGGSYALFFGKKARGDNVFGVDDEVRLYAWYGSVFPTDPNDALIVSARVAGVRYSPQGDSMTYSLKTVNRTEELLNTMVPTSTTATGGTANTAPLAIKAMINRLNKLNEKKNVFAALDNEYINDRSYTNITGSYGNIASTKTTGDAFPTINYNETWKPTYLNIEKLSGIEFTEDENAGDYIFYVKYTPVLPEYMIYYGSYINELVWKPKPTGISNTLIEGSHIVNCTVSLDLKDVQNLLIVNAGTDFRGAGILGVAYDLDSMGKFGVKSGYYTRSRQKFSLLAGSEKTYVTGSLGKFLDPDGMPSSSAGSVAYPLNMTFRDRDVNGNPTSVLVARNKDEWNQYLRDEAKYLAVAEAQAVIEKLSEPRYNLTSDLILGSNNLIPGNIYNFVVPSYGWLGTTENPGYKLRVRDIQHTFNAQGWTTQLEAAEDERVISRMLGNTKDNVTS